jgi:DNA replication and repair protein RecF
MLTNLQIEGFRNLAKHNIQLAGGINLFVGPNGAGKTNLLEAIGLFALAKSCRGAKDSEMVGFGRELAEITADIQTVKKKSK